MVFGLKASLLLILGRQACCYALKACIGLQVLGRQVYWYLQFDRFFSRFKGLLLVRQAWIQVCWFCLQVTSYAGRLLVCDKLAGL